MRRPLPPITAFALLATVLIASCGFFMDIFGSLSAFADTVAVGQTLTANTANLIYETSGTVSYQWRAEGAYQAASPRVDTYTRATNGGTWAKVN